MARIHFYYCLGSCSLASHILLHEAGVPFSTTSLSVAKGFPTSFSHVNPKLRVPVLTIDDETITESPAIMLAISQLCPDKHLMGSTDLERTRVLEWMNWISGTLHGQGYGGLIRPGRYLDDPALHTAIKFKARQTVKDCYDLIEGQLVSCHAVGNRFTAVDAYLYVFYRWGSTDGFEMKQYPRYTALVTELYRRQAAKQAVEVEGIDPYVTASL